MFKSTEPNIECSKALWFFLKFLVLCFGHLNFENLVIVSNFGFRVSNFNAR
jgi:hypothetical protein